MIICKICGKSFFQLHYHLIKMHNIKSSEYNGDLISEELKTKYSNINTGKNNPRFGRKDIKFSKDAKQRYRILLQNKVTKQKGHIKLFKVNCYICKLEFEVKERENLFPSKEKYFCSRSCANTRTFSLETKNKMSISSSKAMKKLWQMKNMLNTINYIIEDLLVKVK